MPRIVVRNGTLRHWRCDAGSYTRMCWLQHAVTQYLGIEDVQQSTIIRRTLALYVDHMEGLIESGNEADLMHTLEKYRLTEANAGKDIGVTDVQATCLPVAPLSDIRKAIHKAQPTVLAKLRKEDEDRTQARKDSAYIATMVGAERGER